MSRSTAVQQHCWPSDVTLSLAAPAVPARYRGACFGEELVPHWGTPSKEPASQMSLRTLADDSPFAVITAIQIQLGYLVVSVRSSIWTWHCSLISGG